MLNLAALMIVRSHDETTRRHSYRNHTGEPWSPNRLKRSFELPLFDVYNLSVWCKYRGKHTRDNRVPMKIIDAFNKYCTWKFWENSKVACVSETLGTCTNISALSHSRDSRYVSLVLHNIHLENKKAKLPSISRVNYFYLHQRCCV